MATRHAVILAAGEGRRLLPLTESLPKCLMEVGSTTILENALIRFADKGVRTVRIVVGHLANRIRERIGGYYRGIEIVYIENPEYAETNSMYSLYLGLQGVQEATWLLEGDVFFEASILDAPVIREISWFIDGVRKDLDGAYISYDEQRRALSLDIVRDLSLLSGQRGKSIGLLHLDTLGVSHFIDWLRDGVAESKKNLYYDLIVGPHFSESCVEIVDIGGRKWFEIDNLADLENARHLFV